MPYPPTIKEEELKTRIAADYFAGLDCQKIVGNIDFSITLPMPAGNDDFPEDTLLWAEAKRGTSHDIYESFVQLILTIGKARTFDTHLPPSLLGAFDAEKIAFIPYNAVQDVFTQNDFNWNVAPSDHATKEFRQLYDMVKGIIDNDTSIFYFDQDDADLRAFIKNNFAVDKLGTTKIQINKNNFITIFHKWQQHVMPTIIVNWEIAKRNGILPRDFYLADLLARDNQTIKEKLYVLLKIDHYELERKISDIGLFSSQSATFGDGQRGHTQFWNKYERPPREEYWNYILERQDTLVDPDIRMRKGSFYTPPQWVELSQKYLADTLGENWQDEYYVWDCAAGTGNLLTGLVNKYNIWASTIDQADVDVMRDRIQSGAANLLDSHVFKFDFLNDDFSKLPQGLQDIINDDEKRKKLVVYINPPYAEVSGTLKKQKLGISFTKLRDKYAAKMVHANRELFAQFLARIYIEIPCAYIAHFSKLKIVQAPNFAVFRKFFLAKFMGGFIIPADTFDNVTGQFPIGFMIWNTQIKEKVAHIVTDVYARNERLIARKKFYTHDNHKLITEWITTFKTNTDKENSIGYLGSRGNDFQSSALVCVYSDRNQLADPRGFWITRSNLIPCSIYLAVRHCIAHTWTNDRNQFLCPKKKWQKDIEFQNNCLVYTLLHGQNRISAVHGVNHWIPFTEYEVDAPDNFASHFMSEFLKGRTFSVEAQAVLDAGRCLWRYYLSQKNVNVNASIYDIREYFQGRSSNGKMNNKSNDEQYNSLMATLRDALKTLAQAIEPKVYDYGFLLK
jgi:hypothetical protein